MAEAHLPPAQTAATCTTARPSPPRRPDTVMRSAARARARREARDELRRRAASPCGSRARCTRRRAARRCRQRTATAARRLRSRTVRTRRTVGLPGGKTAVNAVGVRLPPPPRGDAAGVRPERRRARARADVRRDEDDRPRRRPARRDGAAGRAEEPDVDRAVGELGVEPADDVAARARRAGTAPARSCVPATRARRPTAPRRARRPGGRGTRSSRRRGVDARGERRRARATATTSARFTGPSGTRAPRARRRRAGAAPAPPAKPSVISRDSFLCPSRERSCVVDLAEPLVVRGGEELAAGRPRDRLQRLRARRHADRLLVAARQLVLHDAVRRPEQDRVDGDVQRLRLARGGERRACGRRRARRRR